jgi:serine/threonine protein kinase/Tol biopolymer transport system component
VVAGTRLGPYEIVALLGRGGMGDVYRAHDARLGRDVAIKVLPAAFAADPDRLRRFDQEARAAAALNHPNILQLLDVGTDGPVAYVVLELLEGQTLRAVMEGGHLPLSKAIDYARQVALGLAAAHAKGITHRDVKPDNVFVMPDGGVKILDFGLAKVRETPGASIATRLQQSTGTGLVVGTVAYMSPEQVRAQAVDARSDIFSTGVLLFEMVAGTCPFRGESSVETMSAILKEDPPDLTAAGATLSPALNRIVRHCLEKAPGERFQSARDLAFALEALSGSHAGSDLGLAPPLESQGRSTQRHLPWVVAAAATIALAAALPLAYASLQRAPPASTIRFAVALPDHASFSINFDQQGIAVSPDGRSIAFIAVVDGRSALWIRSFGSTSARIVPNTDGASSPFWSPDSRYIAYFAGDTLRRIDPAGGSRLVICTVPVNMETTGSWGSTGTILYTDRVGDTRSIFRVAASGGTPAALSRKLLHPYWVYFLPDGEHFLVQERATKDVRERGVFVGSLAGADTISVAPSLNTRVEYAQGHLIYVREGSLVAQPFDPGRLQLSGEPATVVERLPYFDQTGWAEFSASSNGVLAYMTDIPQMRVVWLDRAGREVRQLGAPGFFNQIRLSPDGKRLAFVAADPHSISGDIWIQDVARDVATRFAFGREDEGDPVWSPDGDAIAYFMCCDDKWSTERSTLRTKRVGDPGSGKVSGEPGFDAPTDWSQDGRFLMFQRNTPGTTKLQLWIQRVADGTSTRFLESPFSEARGRFSPDGRWVAYRSDETGREEVYVARVNPAGADMQRLSVAGARSPVWRRDGKELFFLTEDHTIASIAVTSGETTRFGAPTALFRNDLIVNGTFDAMPDGQGFVVVTGTAQTLTSPFTVVLNWATDTVRQEPSKSR